MTEDIWTNFYVMFSKKVLEELNIHKDQDINVAICRLSGYIDKLQNQLNEVNKKLCEESFEHGFLRGKIPINHEMGSDTLMKMKEMERQIRTKEEKQKESLIRDIMHTGLFSKEVVLVKFPNDKQFIEKIYSEQQ